MPVKKRNMNFMPLGIILIACVLKGSLKLVLDSSYQHTECTVRGQPVPVPVTHATWLSMQSMVQNYALKSFQHMQHARTGKHKDADLHRLQSPCINASKLHAMH